MIQELREITNTLLNNQSPPLPKRKPQPSYTSVRQLIVLNIDTIDFKQCIPGTVHQKKIILSMKDNQQIPKIITMRIVLEDQRLNQLQEYIFGARKENSYEYFDQFRFKATQKGSYIFIVGVKTPNLVNYKVNARLVVTVEGLSDALQVDLRQTVVIPFVKCCKELVTEEGFRMIKIASIKGKGKKETKVAFRCSDSLNFTLIADLLGQTEEACKQIEVKPKTIPLGGKAMFVLNICTSFPAEFRNEKMTIRKILVFQIKDTNCYFHFPIEVTFYPEGKQTQTVE